MMKIEDFHDIENIIETNGAFLYEAALSDSSYRMYILKKYKKEYSGLGLIENEKEISQEIAHYAPWSIAVPVMNVVRDSEGNQYAVMENKRTGFFLQSMTEKDIPIRDVLRMGEAILRALCTLHAYAGSEPKIGCLHLDLHPGNIFIENDRNAKDGIGRAVFIDFASAVRLLGGQPQERKVWSVSAYSAPELYRGRSGSCSPATDTFSVGAILYNLITGKNIPGVIVMAGTTIPVISPALGPRADTGLLAAEFAGNVCRDKRIPECVCRMIEAFFKCSLDYNPRYRYRSAGEMLDSLSRIRRILDIYSDSEYEELYELLYGYRISSEETGADSMPFVIRKYRKAVASLDRALHQNNIDNRKTKFLFDAYWKIARNHMDDLPGDILYSLIGSGIAVSNHNGDVMLGEELCNELSHVADKMELTQYLDLLNRVAVRKADCFKFKDAIELQRKNIQAQSCIKAGIEEAGRCIGMDSAANTRIIPLARALSSLPGYMILHDKSCPDEKICELYESALREFGNDFGNRRITLCHMMHYAITSGNREQFEKLVQEYFCGKKPCATEQPDMKAAANASSACEGSKVCGISGMYSDGESDTLGLLERFLNDFANENKKDLYNLFVAVKGIYYFYLNDLSGKAWENLRTIGDSVLPDSDTTGPVMLIFKYIGLMDWRRNGAVTEFASKMFFNALNCVQEGIPDKDDTLNIYMLISYQTEAIYNTLIGEGESNEALRAQLREQAVRDGWTELVAALDGGAELTELLCWEYA